MNITIKKISLENFKGFKKKTYDIEKSTKFYGQNGAGKTTISTAFYWVFADKDYDLHSNPPIRPLGVEEVTPRVEVVLDIDGREITVAKFQKCTVKKSRTGGNDTVSLSNSYEVNSVEYGERDFKAKLNEYGFDFDLFLALSHPNVFMGQKSNDMRKVLFSLASEKSDLEIAKATDDVEELTKLLENYTMEEVKAMQNATLRKIKEDYGKDGEILRAKIEGLEMSKSNLDVAEFELGKKAIQELMKSNKAKQEDISKQFDERNKISDDLMKLKFAESDFIRKANEENSIKIGKIEDEISKKKFLLSQTDRTIKETERDIEIFKGNIERLSKELDKCRKEWSDENNRVFDENSLICPYCNQEYPQDKKDELKAEFEKNKAEMKKQIEGKGNKCKSVIEDEKVKMADAENELQSHKESLEMINKKINELQEELNSIPDKVDISDNEEYKQLQSQIEEKEKLLSENNSAEEIRQNLKDEEFDLQLQLVEIEKRIALSAKDVEIDEQISNLRDKQKEYEQNRADCEKILDQLKTVGMKKNEMLTEEINKYFEIVSWQMFEYQKNGEVKDCCIPLIDNMRFGESTNTGREVLAKLDIIKGLQKFYKQNYPVFLDGAECLSEETRKRINMDCQMIHLIVTEDKKIRMW